MVSVSGAGLSKPGRTTRDGDIAGQWRMRTRVQRVWDAPHAAWFSLMGIGGGLFILARLMGLSRELGLWFGLPAVDIVSFLAIGVGGMILLADLGKPFRFLRAVLNVRSSWISRGAVADFVFLVLATLLILPGFKIGSAAPFAGLPWGPEAASGLGGLFEGISIVAALVVMFYAGIVLSSPKSIPYWNSPLVPTQFVLSSAATSTGVLSFFFLAVGKAVTPGVVILQIIFVALLLISIVWHLSTKKDDVAKGESLAWLLRDRYRGLFVGLVITAGTVVPLVLSLIAAASDGARGALMAISAVLLLIGGYYLRLLTLRVGIYPPVRQGDSSGRH